MYSQQRVKASDVYQLTLFVAISSSECRNVLVLFSGSFRTFWVQGALLEGVREQAQLLRSWRHQMGALHRPLRALRDTVLVAARGLLVAGTMAVSGRDEGC